MRFSKSCLVFASLLLAPILICGQQTRTMEGTSLLVRMSFTSSWVPQGFASSPQICFSVDRDGHYEMRRLAMKVEADSPHANADDKLLPGTPYTELLEGALAANELEQLEKFLADPEFRKLAASTPNILRNGAETFVAEVPRDGQVQRVVISNADGEKPFPRSANRIVTRLEHFKAEGAKNIEVSAEDICPRGALQAVNPATASLGQIHSSDGCVAR